MTTDPALLIAVPLIAGFEGFSPTPYYDVKGWAIGYGFHTLSDGSVVTSTTAKFTIAEAEDELTVQVAKYLSAVRSMVHVPITNNAAAALTSLSYNEGTSRLRNSTTIMLPLNQGKYQQAADGFMAWVYAGGKFSADLYDRRQKERALFLLGDSTDA